VGKTANKAARVTTLAENKAGRLTTVPANLPGLCDFDRKRAVQRTLSENRRKTRRTRASASRLASDLWQNRSKKCRLEGSEICSYCAVLADQNRFAANE
jgi:hypothetical protein